MLSMVRIGKLVLDAPFFQAGLAGYSDAAMRLVARRHGCPYCVTEAMLDRFLVNGGRGLKAAELDDNDHPIAGQLMGSHPVEMGQAARILVKLGYDVIDVNLACPVKKIRKRSRGGHLLSVPDEAIAILDDVRQAVGEDMPCTVKLRRATDDSAEAQANFHRIFEQVVGLGYTVAVVHGRSVVQKYNGPSRWSSIKSLVQQYGSTPGLTIGGSGDIWCASDIFDMIKQTGVQLVSVARGCIGNPWIFMQARAMMAGNQREAQRKPTIEQQRDVLLEHFRLSVALHGQVQASKMMRKFGIRFSAYHPQGEAVKGAFIKVESLQQWQNVINDFYSDHSPVSDSSHSGEILANAEIQG